MTKEQEIERWRGKHRFYTEETMRKLASEEQLSKNARLRCKLYDWVINGRIGKMPTI